ncbi:MAG: hypothetical protein C5B51_17490 [Terriglobia bacterium]|nr:MAG: hypothetical protein C5B51_17490 [Terriglobia bacterium]
MASAGDLHGTWKRLPALAFYKPGPKPESHVRVYEHFAEGLKVSCTEIIEGKEISWHYTIPAFDGKVYPVYGRNDADGIKAFQLSETEVLGIFIKDGVETAICMRELSSDGRTLIVIESGADDGQGQPYWNTAVFTKQVAPWTSRKL